MNCKQSMKMNRFSMKESMKGQSLNGEARKESEQDAKG